MQNLHKALFTAEASLAEKEEFRSKDKAKQDRKKAMKSKMDSMTLEERKKFAAEKK